MGRTPRKTCSAFLVAAGLCLLVARSGHAETGPSAEDIKVAGTEYDLGRQSYKKKKWVEASEHFEMADSRAPSAVTLELALRSRDKASQLDRAAMLAALALRRHPKETALVKLAESVLKRGRAELHSLTVKCSPACDLVLGTKLVHGVAATERTVFLAPGTTQVNASWSGGRTRSSSLEATKGGSGELSFEAPPEPKPEDATPAQAKPRPASAVAPGPAPAPAGDAGAEAKGGLPPLVFFVGAGLTAVAGGLTIWSGIDTQNNPGKDKVREQCAGQGTSCPAYQDGLDRQNRTNLLLGVTAGVGVVSGVIGAFFTDWSGKADKKSAGISPFVEVGRGASVGARGSF